MSPPRRTADLTQLLLEKMERVEADVSELKTMFERRLGPIENVPSRVDAIEVRVTGIEKVLAQAEGAARLAGILWGIGGALLMGAAWLFTTFLHH